MHQVRGDAHQGLSLVDHFPDELQVGILQVA
jgi:hypothetical protein